MLNSVDKHRVLVGTTDNLLYSLVNREVGFSVTDNQCYIKYNDSLVPIGGSTATLNIRGSATCEQINAMQGMASGDIYSVTDSGTIQNEDGSTLEVTAGDLIYYSGSGWKLFLHIDLDGYVTDVELEATIAVVRAAIDSATSAISSHTSNKQNPHNVTAEQVGTYDKATIDEKIGRSTGLDMEVSSDVVSFFYV